MATFELGSATQDKLPIPPHSADLALRPPGTSSRFTGLLAGVGVEEELLTKE